MAICKLVPGYGVGLHFQIPDAAARPPRPGGTHLAIALGTGAIVAELYLFRLVSEPYGEGSIILTSKKSY